MLSVRGETGQLERECLSAPKPLNLTINGYKVQFHTCKKIAEQENTGHVTVFYFISSVVDHFPTTACHWCPQRKLIRDIKIASKSDFFCYSFDQSSFSPEHNIKISF